MTPSDADASGIVFDMDGVLVDSGAHHRDAWRALCADLSVTPPDEFWRLTIGRPAEEAVGRLLGRRLDAPEARRLAGIKHQHYARLCARGMLPVAGVLTFVRELARRGVPRAVATSASRRDVERMLGDLGLRPHFDVVVTADDVRWGKPNPEVYVKSAQGLGLPPARCLVFEDSIVGIHAARNAGMRVIGVTTAHSGRELIGAGAERTIDTFEGFTWPT